MVVTGNKPVARVDFSKEFGPLSSGKSVTIASAEDNNVEMPSPERIKARLDVYKKSPGWMFPGRERQIQ